MSAACKEQRDTLGVTAAIGRQFGVARRRSPDLLAEFIEILARIAREEVAECAEGEVSHAEGAAYLRDGGVLHLDAVRVANLVPHAAAHHGLLFGCEEDGARGDASLMPSYTIR